MYRNYDYHLRYQNESCALIGYSRGQDGPTLPAWDCRLDTAQERQQR